MIQALRVARRRTLFLQFALALLLAVILAELPSAAASISNGDFEDVQIGPPFFSTNPTDVPGWTHTGDDGGGFLWAIGFSDPGGTVTVAGSGNQFVTMGGGFDHVGTSSWSSVITGLSPGNDYLLDFMMADENTFTSVPQQVTVDFTSGSSTLPVTFAATLLPSTNYWTVWQNQEMMFLATDTSATLRFTATTQYDVGLDNVRVTDTVVPEPDSLPIVVACCLLSLAFNGLRSQARSASSQGRAKEHDPSA